MLHRGYEVWVANGKNSPIPELNIKVDETDDGIITCYIPSESGKQFSIRWRDHGGTNDTSMKIFVDGLPAGKTHCPPGTSGVRIGLRTNSADAYHLFQFADLQTSDDDGVLWEPGPSEQLGTIELRVVHVKPQPRHVEFQPRQFIGVGSVHERSKKAGTHCVTLGNNERRAKQGNRVRTTPIHAGGRPCARFMFRYRPAAILQAQQIMPSQAAGPNTAATRRNKQTASATLANNEKAQSVKLRSKAELEQDVPRIDAVILLSDSEDIDKGRHTKVKLEMPFHLKVKIDPDDVIDLTLD